MHSCFFTFPQVLRGIDWNSIMNSSGHSAKIEGVEIRTPITGCDRDWPWEEKTHGSALEAPLCDSAR